MKIQFFRNGLEIDNGKKTFIAYQNISHISDVYYTTNYDSYDVLTRSFVEDNVEKFVYFKIHVVCSRNYFLITCKDYKRSFPRIDKNGKQISFFKFIYLSLFKNYMQDGCSNEAREWLDSTKDIEQIIENTKQLRKLVIDKYNEWKIKTYSNETIQKLCPFCNYPQQIKEEEK